MLRWIPIRVPVRVMGLIFLTLVILSARDSVADANGTANGKGLLKPEDIVFTGAFRIKASKFGASEINYAQGALAYNPANDSLFIVGHTYQQAVAEFKIPKVKKAKKMADLDRAETPLQPFARILTRVSGGNPQKLDRIGGMALVDTSTGPKLLINAYQYYDAPGKTTQTTCVVSDPANLNGSAIDGFFTFEGGAGHTSGWLSPIPKAYQSVLGGDYLTGQSSGFPIISRLSVGPSLFAFTIDPVSGIPLTAGKRIPTVKCLDYSIGNPLHKDLSNDTGTNTIWTHLSRALTGFIPPGFRSYVTLGSTGGHTSGVCYKCTPKNGGKKCGGYCAKDSADYSLYYWLWDLDDLEKVRRKAKPSYSVKPYAYGVFQAPFPGSVMGGGTFDPLSGRLFLSLLEADKTQGRYARPPLIAVYKIGSNPAPKPAPTMPKPKANASQPRSAGKKGLILYPIIYPDKAKDQ